MIFFATRSLLNHHMDRVACRSCSGSSDAIQSVSSMVRKAPAMTSEVPNNRRVAKNIFQAGFAGLAAASKPADASADAYAPLPLPYDYSALEPAIGTPTMKVILRRWRYFETYFDDSSVSIFYYWLHGNLNKIAPS